MGLGFCTDASSQLQTRVLLLLPGRRPTLVMQSRRPRPATGMRHRRPHLRSPAVWGDFKPIQGNGAPYTVKVRAPGSALVVGDQARRCLGQDSTPSPCDLGHVTHLPWPQVPRV